MKKAKDTYCGMCGHTNADANKVAPDSDGKRYGRLRIALDVNGQRKTLCGICAQGSKDLAEAYRTTAKRLYHEEGEIEVDHDAKISAGDDGGAYVQAWVWVPTSEALGESK